MSEASESIESSESSGELAAGRADDGEAGPLVVTRSATSVRWTVTFWDHRAPEVLQSAMERDVLAPFRPAMEQGVLVMRAWAQVNGARFEFELRFEGGAPEGNAYRLQVETSWAEQPEPSHEYFRKTSESWFRLWTQDFVPAEVSFARNPGVIRDAAWAGRYREQCEAVLRTEASLDSVTSIQAVIVTAMKEGAAFATAHREGGSRLWWEGGRLRREDYGEDPGRRDYVDESGFLAELRGLYRAEIDRHAGAEPRGEVEAWRIIWRQLQRG
jgi:hypothetical protein